jgi:hypothetical protein
MTYATQAVLAVDAAFRDRVRVAIVTTGFDAMGENKGGRDDTVFNKRQALAARVLSDSAEYLERFAWGLASIPAISAASTDNELLLAVRSIWDDLSGVIATD